MAYFVITMEGISVEKLIRLFRDNVWKLYRLPESTILDRSKQLAVELIKKLNKILEIETKLLVAFYLQIDR